VQTKTESRSGRQVDPPEQAVIAEVGGAIAEATERREAGLGDPRAAARRAAVEIASAMLDASSAETAAHSDDVDVITEGIGRMLGLSEQGLDDTLLAARLHDIGKLGVPHSIINKPAPLDSGEWKLMHRHTIIGEQILLAVPELRGVAHLVRHSHERWDGGGYPDGLAGEDIPLGSRIVFCADAYHAIRSDRPYRRGRSAAESLAEVRSCAGTQFDPAVVEALEAVAAEIRAAGYGSRPRAVRPRRLMALMLIISVGACGSAFARSGVMPEAKGSASTQAAGSNSSAAGTAAADPEMAVPTAQLDALNASRLNADSTLVPVGLLSALPPSLTISSDPVLAPGAELPVLGGADVAGDLAKEEVGSPVRDHGRGIGRGKGKGKARGSERGDKKLKQSKTEPGKGSPAAAGKGRSKAPAPKASQSSGKSGASSGKAKTADSGKAKSAGTTTGKTASPPKPQKPDKALKPPKTDVAATPPAAEPPSAAPAGVPSRGGSGNGNPGSNGNGH